MVAFVGPDEKSTARVLLLLMRRVAVWVHSLKHTTFEKYEQKVQSCQFWAARGANKQDEYFNYKKMLSKFSSEEQ